MDETVDLSSRALDRLPADLLVVPIAGDLGPDSPFAALDRRAGGRLRRDATRLGFTGAAAQELWLHPGEPRAAHTVLLLGAGADPRLAFWYELADALVRHAGRLRAARAVVGLGALATPAVVGAVAEGIALARYAFTRYRSRPPREAPLAVTLQVESVDAAQRRAVAEATVFAAAACLARDLANTPAADLAPNDLGRAARRLAGKGLRVRVHDHRALRRLGMGAILGVGGGSAQPPCLIEMVYKPPGGARRSIALVGKGITFDSGGLSIKTADSMQWQKRDMAGAAVVLGVMAALPALRLPIEVRGYIPSAENMPSGTAMRPGDVLRAYNGTTIEVLNTDAEGRLVLADALAYAASHKPDLMLDFATLTAVVRTALGTRCAAILGSDRGLVGACLAAAAEANELLWELPLFEEYRRDLDSRIADLKNVGEGHAGTIVAALFLREFVGGVPWAHVDFSSTVMSDGYACHPKGASGYAVRTTLRLLAHLAEDALAAPQAKRSGSSAKRRAQTGEQK